MTRRILIRNARLVNEGRIVDGDLLIADGRIDRIAGSITLAAEIEIDAAGAWLLPGMIDDQVHFREPGLTHKGCIASESAAAVAGGITSFMDMPNTRPPTLDMAAVDAKRALAAAGSHANYAFHLGVSTHNLDAVAAADPTRIAGIKVFMGASTGDMLVDDPAVLERLFACAPTLLLAHCEDTPTILANEAAWRARCGDDIPFDAHPLIRSAEACYRSSSLAVGLARRHGTRLHVLHLSTAQELALFDDGPLAGKQITAEACLHHLLFDDSGYANLGSTAQVQPGGEDPAGPGRPARRRGQRTHRRHRHRPRPPYPGREGRPLRHRPVRPAPGPARPAGADGAGARRGAGSPDPGPALQPRRRRPVPDP